MLTYEEIEEIKKTGTEQSIADAISRKLGQIMVQCQTYDSYNKTTLLKNIQQIELYIEELKQLAEEIGKSYFIP